MKNLTAEKVYAVSFKGIKKIQGILSGSTAEIRKVYCSKIPPLKTEDFIETGISCHLPDLVFTDKRSKAKDDEKNTILVHSALKSLTRRQAASMSIWLWFTHFRYWEYMQKRWHGVSDKSGAKLKSYIDTRYSLFSNSSRAFFRNGISRLWWYGEITFDEKDQYLNTSIMLERLDITQNLVERTIGRIPEATKAIFSILLKNKKYYSSSKKNAGRIRIRNLIKSLGWTGTKELLDMKTKGEIEKMLRGVS